MRIKHICASLSVLAAALLLTGGIAVRAENAAENRFVSIADGSVNIRKKPSEEGEVIGKLYPGGIGTVLKKKDDSEWVWIRSGRVRGYISADLIADGEEAESLIEQAGYQEAQVLPGGASVYYDADDTTEVVAAPGESTFLTVLEENGEWISVRTPFGVEGWVRSDQVKLSTVYSTAETLAAEEERLESIEQADAAAALESEL